MAFFGQNGFLTSPWRFIEDGAQSFSILSQAESICFHKLRNLCWPICLVSRPKAFQFLPRRTAQCFDRPIFNSCSIRLASVFTQSLFEPTTARAGNLTGTLTQPVFNELARLIRDRLSDTNYTHSQSPLLFFLRKPHECLSGDAPEFLCRASPDIRNASVGRDPSSVIYQIFVCCRL